jgi:predicted phosphodiesterase
MTRILACSDIHNNIAAVRKLRSREANDCDAVIVAGDIGSKAAHEIFAVLRTFGCPVLFVLGNWDHGVGHRDDFGKGCHHLHLSPFRLGDLSIVGESIDGIDPTWEAMRAEIEAKPERLSAAREEYFQRQQALLPKIVADEGFERTVVVTHYRLTRTRYYLPGVPLFLFGHNHGFKDTTFLGSRFVNVSALDSKVMVVRQELNRVRHNNYRFINDGSYVVISYDRRQGFSIEPRSGGFGNTSPSL